MCQFSQTISIQLSIPWCRIIRIHSSVLVYSFLYPGVIHLLILLLSSSGNKQQMNGKVDSRMPAEHAIFRRKLEIDRTFIFDRLLVIAGGALTSAGAQGIFVTGLSWLERV